MLGLEGSIGGGGPFQGDLVAAFLAWLALSGLIANWVTTRLWPQVLIAIGGAAVGTAVTIVPGLSRYWWVVGLAAAGIAIHRYTIRVITERNALAGRNERLKRMIRTLAQEHKRAYKLRETIETRIDHEGTSVSTRISEIIATTESVSWIDMGYGTNVSNPRGSGVILEAPEVFDDQGRRLDYESTTKLKVINECSFSCRARYAPVAPRKKSERFDADVERGSN